MRVSSGQLSQLVLQGLQRQDKQYAQLMTQMSSGYRINKISDDPLGTVTLLGIEREQTSYTQYRSNIDRVISRLEQTETYLDNSFTVLLRVQDLALDAVNGARTQSDRQAIAGELKNLFDTLVSFANARDEDGNYLFSGSKLNLPPVADTGSGLTYRSEERRREVPVAQGVTLTTNETIESVYFNGGSFFADLEAFIQDLETNTTTGPQIIDSVQRTINGLNQKLTEVGSRIVSARNLDSAQ